MAVILFGVGIIRLERGRRQINTGCVGKQSECEFISPVLVPLAYMRSYPYTETLHLGIKMANLVAMEKLHRD